MLEIDISGEENWLDWSLVLIDQLGLVMFLNFSFVNKNDLVIAGGLGTKVKYAYVKENQLETW